MVLSLMFGMVNLHNWEGPALIPEGNRKKVNIIFMVYTYTKEEWKKLEIKEKVTLL